MPRTTRVLGCALVAVSIALGGCGAAAGGSATLSVANRSERTVFIRFETDAGQAVTYRVGPGAVGRAEAPEAGRPPDRLALLAADCTVISEQSDPALGQLVIDRSSTVFTAAADPQVSTRPLLPTDATCP